MWCIMVLHIALPGSHGVDLILAYSTVHRVYLVYRFLETLCFLTNNIIPSILPPSSRRGHVIEPQCLGELSRPIISLRVKSIKQGRNYYRGREGSLFCYPHRQVCRSHLIEATIASFPMPPKVLILSPLSPPLHTHTHVPPLSSTCWVWVLTVQMWQEWRPKWERARGSSVSFWTVPAMASTSSRSCRRRSEMSGSKHCRESSMWVSVG